MRMKTYTNQEDYSAGPWDDSTAGEIEEEEEEFDTTDRILNSPELYDGILRAIEQLKEGIFLTHEQVFGHPLP